MMVADWNMLEIVTVINTFQPQGKKFPCKICSGLPPCICPGQNPVVLRYVRDQGSPRAGASACGFLSLISSFSRPTEEPNLS